MTRAEHHHHRPTADPVARGAPWPEGWTRPALGGWGYPGVLLAFAIVLLVGGLFLVGSLGGVGAGSDGPYAAVGVLGLGTMLLGLAIVLAPPSGYGRTRTVTNDGVPTLVLTPSWCRRLGLVVCLAGLAGAMAAVVAPLAAEVGATGWSPVAVALIGVPALVEGSAGSIRLTEHGVSYGVSYGVRRRPRVTVAWDDVGSVGAVERVPGGQGPMPAQARHRYVALALAVGTRRGGLRRGRTARLLRADLALPTRYLPVPPAEVLGLVQRLAGADPATRRSIVASGR